MRTPEEPRFTEEQLAIIEGAMFAENIHPDRVQAVIIALGAIATIEKPVTENGGED
jgi:hypothetical protein